MNGAHGFTAPGAPPGPRSAGAALCTWVLSCVLKRELLSVWEVLVLCGSLMRQVTPGEVTSRRSLTLRNRRPTPCSHRSSPLDFRCFSAQSQELKSRVR